jgi:transposase-like protein
MAGRNKSYAVALGEQERQALERIAAARKSPQGEADRARVLLTCDRYRVWTDKAVVKEVGCSAALMRKWRRRWQEVREP